MIMKVFYIYPDYIEDWFEETDDRIVTEELCCKFVKEGKGTLYSHQSFEDAFNNDQISDMGIIKFFNTSTKYF